MQSEPCCVGSHHLYRCVRFSTTFFLSPNSWISPSVDRTMALQSLLSITKKKRIVKHRKRHRAMKKRFRDNNNDRMYYIHAQAKATIDNAHTHNIRQTTNHKSPMGMKMFISYLSIFVYIILLSLLFSRLLSLCHRCVCHALFAHRTQYQTWNITEKKNEITENPHKKTWQQWQRLSLTFCLFFHVICEFGDCSDYYSSLYHTFFNLYISDACVTSFMTGVAIHIETCLCHTKMLCCDWFAWINQWQNGLLLLIVAFYIQQSV